MRPERAQGFACEGRSVESWAGGAHAPRRRTSTARREVDAPRAVRHLARRALNTRPKVMRMLIQETFGAPSCAPEGVPLGGVWSVEGRGSPRPHGWKSTHPSNPRKPRENRASVRETEGEGSKKGPEKGPEKEPRRIHASRETLTRWAAPNTEQTERENTVRITPSVPLHATPGFLPAFQRARQRRPDVAIATWRTIATMHAAPGQHGVTAAELGALVDSLAPRRRVRA